MPTEFRYVSPPSRLLAGSALTSLAAEVARAGMSRPIVFCGATIGNGSPSLRRVQAELQDLDVHVFSGVQQNSPVTAVEAAVAAVRECEADGILALGGGSAIVTARAATVSPAVVERAAAGYAPVAVPHLLLPTTPSTAMARSGAAVSDAATGRRLEMFDPRARPAAILLDRDLLGETDEEVFLDAAVATFCNAAEGLTSAALGPLARADLREAVASASWALSRLSDDSSAAEARLALACAAYLCGRAADSQGGRLATIGMAMGHQVQMRGRRVSHGSAMSAVLGAALRFNGPLLPEGHRRLVDALHLGTPKTGDAATDCASVLAPLGMPLTLREVGLDRAAVPQLAEGAMESHFVRVNARPVTSVTELEGAFDDAW
jgi:alcohol dehydrogenase class IV